MYADTKIDNHGHVIADGIAIAKRNLIGYTRVPELLVFSTVQLALTTYLDRVEIVV